MIQRFGFWRAALHAAGLLAPAPREYELPLAERVDVARRLDAHGITATEIAAAPERMRS